MAMGSNRGLIIAVVGAALLLAVTLLAYRTPVPLPANAPATVFSAVRARDILKELVGDGVPHPIGSAADARVRDRIVKRLSALGYTTELQSGVACNTYGECGTPTNIVATRGAIGGDDAVMIAAHYDSVPSGPGASDDGVGVANLLEVARVLTALPATRHPIVLLVTDGEEAGLLGAQLFAREHRLAKRIKAAVNMDTRGVSGPSLMFETGTANAWLMRLYGGATLEPITNSLCYVIYKSLPNNTDFTVFKEAGYQGLNFAFIGDVAYYHTPLDNWENSSATTMQHQGANALGSLLALADSKDLSPPASDSLFFDVLARTVIVWPIAAVLPAALAALAIVVLGQMLLMRSSLLTAQQALLGFVGACVNLLLGAATSVAVLMLLRFLGRLPPMGSPSWIAHPMAMHVGFAALTVFCSCVSAAWFGRRAGFWGFWFGASMLTAMFSVAAAILMPAAGYVLLVTALAAAFGLVPCIMAIQKQRAPSRSAADFAVLLPGLIGFAVLLPLLMLLYSALGAVAWPLSTVTLCLSALFLLPFLAEAVLPRQRLLLLSLGVIFAAVCITVLLPTYSARWPQRMNIEYWLDADEGKAHWWTQTASLRLPGTMAEAIKFDPLPRERFAGYPLKGFFAAAPALKLSAPELTPVVVADAASAAHIELLLRSTRGAPTGFVVFPASANVKSVLLATPSGPLRAKLHTLSNGATVLLAPGMPETGLRFGIDAAAPMTVQVFDENYALPEELSDGKTLQHARPQTATSSQDGDVTVVQRTVRLDPAAGR
jgi:Peptidase family M28